MELDFRFKVRRADSTAAEDSAFFLGVISVGCATLLISSYNGLQNL